MKKKVKGAIAAFALPVILWILVYIAEGQYPFGDRTLLRWDMNWQYISFFSHLHDILHGDASAFYTFSRAIGGDMAGVFGYYLMSPFNLLFFFFDAEHIYAGVLLVTLLKAGSCGLAMYLYLRNRGGELSSLLFSTLYALCAYVTAYQFNLFWIDALIFLPLMVWGIERLVDEQKYLLYVISLGLAVAVNFYTGYMLCLFSVLYFLCYFFLISRKEKKWKTVGIYVGASLCGGALSAFMALPMLFSLQGGKSSFSLSALKDFSKLLGFRELIRGSFMGMVSFEQITRGRPLIYCSVFALLMAGIWFLCREVRIQEKIAYLVILICLIASFAFTNLNLVWHGFNPPMGSPHRFSFLYAFVLLTAAHRGFEQWQKDSGSGKRMILGVIAAVLLLVLLFERSSFVQLERNGIWVFNLVWILLYGGALLVPKEKVQVWGCLGLACVEVLCSAAYLYVNAREYQPVTVTEYQEYQNRVAPLIAEVNGEDKPFRTVMTGDAYRTSDDSLMFNLYGLDSYTSVEKYTTMLIARNLGYSISMEFGMKYGDGAARAAESLLGVKYLITSEEPDHFYEEHSAAGGLRVYENPAALPFVYLVEDPLAGWGDGEYRVFENLNAFYQNLVCGSKEKVLIEEQTDQRDMQGCTRQEDGSFTAYEGETGAYVEYDLPVEYKGNYYLQYGEYEVDKAELAVNGERYDLSEQGNTVKRLGTLTPQDTVSLRFYFSDGHTFDPQKVYVCREDEKRLVSYAQEVREQPVEIEFKSDSHLRILCTNGDEGQRYLLCTIPYDAGWKVTVDGEKVQPADSEFLVIPVSPGNHEIELRFVPRGMYAGLMITGIAALGLAAVVIIQRKKR